MPEPLPLPICQPEEIIRAIVLGLQLDEYLGQYVATWQAFLPEEDISEGLAPWAEASLPAVRIYPTVGRNTSGWIAAPWVEEVRLPLAIETAVAYPDIISSARLWERIADVLHGPEMKATLDPLGVSGIEVVKPGYGLAKFDDASPAYLPGDGEIVVTFSRSYR